jgi:hypothetical protein
VSVVVPPEAPRSAEPEALIREARERQRRRRILIAVGMAVAAATGLSALAAIPTRHGATRDGDGRLSAVASLPRCRVDQVRVTAPPNWNSAAGSLLEPFTLRNVSSATCSVAGWPAVRLIGAAGRVVPTRSFRYVYSERDKVPFQAVTVRPGSEASFNYFASDWNHLADHACPNARNVDIRLPGARSWISLNLSIPACGAVFVDPFVAGATDGRWGAIAIQHFSRP